MFQAYNGEFNFRMFSQLQNNVKGRSGFLHV